MASADLGPLGARAGAPVAYHWLLPNLAPQLLPWLVILGLLALKPNRNGAAWLIWLPVICVLLIIGLPLGLPSQTDFLLDVAVALAFGLAAVWLLSTYLRRGHRLATALCVALVLGGFGILCLGAKQSVTASSGEWVLDVIVLGLGVLANVVALAVAGWLCRRHFDPVRLYLCFLVSLPILWLGLTIPFFLVALSQAGGLIAWSEFLAPVAVVAGINFALLLPFLILSSANTLFRERLKGLLHVAPAAAPQKVVLAEPEPVARL